MEELGFGVAARDVLHGSFGGSAAYLFERSTGCDGGNRGRFGLQMAIVLTAMPTEAEGCAAAAGFSVDEARRRYHNGSECYAVFGRSGRSTRYLGP